MTVPNYHAGVPSPSEVRSVRRIQFSFLSLTVLLIFLACGFALFDNWSPWRLKFVANAPGSSHIWDVDFSPDAQQLAVAGGPTVQVYGVQDGAALYTLKGHDSVVTGVAYSPSGDRIVTCGFQDQTARVWDAVSGACLLTLSGHTDLVHVAAFSHDGKKIITASMDYDPCSDKTARVWDSVTGKQLSVLRGHDDCLETASFSPDDRWIVTTSWKDNTMRLWDSITGRELRALHPSWPITATYSNVSNRILATGTGNTVRIYDPDTLDEVTVLRGHEDIISTARFSADDRLVVTASHDRTARIWETSTGNELVVLRGHSEWVLDAEFSRDGSRVVTAGADHTARIWDVETGVLLAVLRGHQSQVLIAKFAPTGDHVVTTAYQDSRAMIWKRNRPESSLGPFGLLETWFTMLFGGLLIWSLRRDRKTFKRLREEAAAKDAA